MTDPRRPAAPQRGPGVAETVRITSIICAAMVSGLVLMVVVALVIAQPRDPTAALPGWAPAIPVVLGLGAGLYLQLAAFRPRPLPPTARPVGPDAVLAGWRTAFFLAIAVPEVAGIAGFAVSVAVSSYWPAVIGVLFAAPLVVVWCRPRVSLPRYLRALERDGGRTGLLDPTGTLVNG